MKDNFRKSVNIWQKRIEEVKKSSFKFMNLPTNLKNYILKEIGDQIKKNKHQILQANMQDIENAKKHGLSSAFIERLSLNDKKINEMLDGINTVMKIDDPVGEIIDSWHRPKNLEIKKVRVPLGVILIIYESRPNVTVDSCILSFKSGNCVILRGGRESVFTNTLLVKLIKNAIDYVWDKKKLKIPRDILLFIDDPSYNLMYKILKMEGYIDLVIPRGGEEMVKNVKRHSTISVLSHGSGICHTYVDEFANIEKSIKVCFNAKVQRPSVCNAMETLLVHEKISERFLPDMIRKFIDAGVEIRGCQKTKSLLKKYNIEVKSASEKDWSTEYLALILSVKIVDDIWQAIEHINKYGSHHSDAILTENRKNAKVFFNEVDSAAVFLNASTRLHDGGIFGFGTEIGISTSKLHSRGTMGLKDLTTSKFIVLGNGNIRD